MTVMAKYVLLRYLWIFSYDYEAKISEIHIGNDRGRRECVNWIYLAQVGNNTIVKLLVPYNAENFWFSRGTVSVSRKSLLLELI